jgi:hypothetical protein
MHTYRHTGAFPGLEAFPGRAECTSSKMSTRLLLSEFRLSAQGFRHLLKGEDEVAFVRVFLGVLYVGQTQIKDLFAVLPFKDLAEILKSQCPSKITTRIR